MQPIIERIQKLLALAGNNSNEHEAAAAAEKAAALMAEHNISVLSINRSTNTHAERKDKVRKGGLYAWQRDIWKAVADLNFCVYFSIKGTTKGSSYEQRLVGSEVNVISAEVLGDYLQQTIDRMGHAWAKSNGYKSGFVRQAIAYREGLALGLVVRIRKIISDRETAAQYQRHANKTNGDSTALTIIDVMGTEQDLNKDYLAGYEPGTHARLRREYEERARAREEANRKWREENPEQAAALDRQQEEDIRAWQEEYARKLKRRKNESKPRARALTDREKRASLSAHTIGYYDSEKVSLNKQVDEEQKTAIK